VGLFRDLHENEDLAARLHVTKDFDATIRELDPALVHFGYGTLALGRMRTAGLTDCRTVVSFRGYDVNYFGLDDPTASTRCGSRPTCCTSSAATPGRGHSGVAARWTVRTR
jgi:hypothetical protein